MDKPLDAFFGSFDGQTVFATDTGLNKRDVNVVIRPRGKGFSLAWTTITQKTTGKIKRAELRDTVHLEVRKAHQNPHFWSDEWPARESEFNDLRGLYDAAGSSAGLSGAASVLRAQRRYLEAVTEHLISRAQLERAIGRAIADPS
ncbi:MAG: hypothetical protein IIC84_01455 [Chloroflexi bacterium]|nr:hypothetical protein [Chloroflexota bacterium]